MVLLPWLGFWLSCFGPESEDEHSIERPSAYWKVDESYTWHINRRVGSNVVLIYLIL